MYVGNHLDWLILRCCIKIAGNNYCCCSCYDLYFLQQQFCTFPSGYFAYMVKMGIKMEEGFFCVRSRNFAQVTIRVIAASQLLLPQQLAAPTARKFAFVATASVSCHIR